MGRMIEIDNDGQKLEAYLAEPEGRQIKGGLIVIHEVWGLNEHTKQVADRFALEGYITLAPGLIDLDMPQSLLGELQRDLFDPAKRTEIQPKLRELTAPIHAPGFAEATMKILNKCFDYLYETTEVNQKVAVIGFCFGGSYSFSLAVNEPRLKAAVPFYGHADFEAEELAKINCPVRAFYGEKDDRLVNELDKLKADMKRAGVDFEAQVYPDCGHAFFNDSNPNSYNRAAADDAMVKTLKFLSASL